MSWLKSLIHFLKLMDFRANRATFYEQLARSVFVDEGYKVFLEAEHKISSAKATRDSSRAYALGVLRARLQSGSATQYSQTLGAVMPSSDRLMLAALDKAPDKVELMRTIAKSIREQEAMVAVVRKKAIVPILMLPAAFGFAWIMATKSIPIIVKMAPPEVWTPFNQAVRSFAEAIAAYGPMVAVAAVAAVAFFIYQLPRWRGSLRAKLESMSPTAALLLFPVCPILLPLSVYRDVQAGLVFSSLAVMMESGRTLTESLTALQRNSQPWLRWQLGRILAYLNVHPTEYQHAFSRGLVSPSLLARMSSSLRTNEHFDDVLVQLGQEGSVEVREHVEKQATRINALLLIAAAGCMAFMVVGNLTISNTMTEELSQTKQLARQLKAINAKRPQQAPAP